MVDLGVAGATAFSLPRSVGSIFGLIFASAQPLGLDDIAQKLEISRGSASMGLNYLHKMGAIKAVETQGIRRTVYEPEMSVRRLIEGILQATVLPHLRDSGERLAALEQSLISVDPTDQSILKARLKTLRGWRSKAQTLAPVVKKILGAKKPASF